MDYRTFLNYCRENQLAWTMEKQSGSFPLQLNFLNLLSLVAASRKQHGVGMVAAQEASLVYDLPAWDLICAENEALICQE